MLELSRVSAAKDREVLCASFETNIRRLEREMHRSKRAKMMHIIKLRAMAGRLEAGDAARREAAHKSEARGHIKA